MFTSSNLRSCVTAANRRLHHLRPCQPQEPIAILFGPSAERARVLARVSRGFCDGVRVRATSRGDRGRPNQ